MPQGPYQSLLPKQGSGNRHGLFRSHAPPVAEAEKGDPAANVEPTAAALVCFKGSQVYYIIS